MPALCDASKATIQTLWIDGWNSDSSISEQLQLCKCSLLNNRQNLHQHNTDLSKHKHSSQAVSSEDNHEGSESMMTLLKPENHESFSWQVSDRRSQRNDVTSSSRVTITRVP